MNTSISVVCYKSKTLSNDEYPLKENPSLSCYAWRKKLIFKQDETEKWMIKKRVEDTEKFINQKNIVIREKLT